jgi:hypothetical protein
MPSLAQQISIADAERFADSLLKKDILNQKGKDLLLKEIADSSIEVEHRSTVNPISYTSTSLYKETVLEFCYRAFSTANILRLDEKNKVEQKIKNKEPLTRTSWTVNPLFLHGGTKEYADCISNNRSTIGYTRNKTLNDFHDIGLINDKVYVECKQALDDSSIHDELDLLRYMLERSTYYTFYAFNKKEQEDYIEKLVQWGFLTNDGRDSLLKSYASHELKSIPEMLQYSKRYVLVDLLPYKPDPATTYPVILEAIKKLLPDFNYYNLKTKIIEEKESDLIRQDIKLSFSVDSNTYRHTFFHDYRKQKPSKQDVESTPSRVDQDFHKGVNKWLTDIESPFRLYTFNIPDKDEGAYGSRRVGLMILKEGEAEKITGESYLISRETFDNRLSKRNIDKLVDQFTDQGFFKHLSQKEIDSAKEKIRASDIGSFEELLLHFPKTIVFFDWETGNLENPYEELTKAFADASRGLFKPEAIVDEFPKGFKKAKEIKYGFTFNNHRYETMLKFESDWLDPEFMELIKKALKENNVDGNIYYCLDNGQESGYIFLSSRQYEFIKANYSDLLKD